VGKGKHFFFKEGNTMAYWDTFYDLESLRREMDNIVDNMGTWRFPFSRVSFLPGRAARRYPLVNVNEDKDAYYIEALAPGVNPKTFDVSVIDNMVTIAGEKNMAAPEVKAESYHRNERAVGKFVRIVELANEVNEAKIKADYKNGLLLVTLPKSEKAKPKQITVNVH
jgi:HSP20 family protein